MTKVVYLMSNKPHLPYLVASLHTLRDHWDGDVEVYAYPTKYSFSNGKVQDGSYDIVQRIAEDNRLNIKPYQWIPSDTNGKNNQFINKIELLRTLDTTVIYLDADTTIHGRIDELGKLANEHGFVATQFNRWDTSGKLIQGRIKRLLDFHEDIPKVIVESVIQPPYVPSLNGGILSCIPSSKVLAVWRRWSYTARSIFIADESVLHILQKAFSDRMFFVKCGGEFNCSHKYRDRSGIKKEDIKIYHYHGDSAVRKEKAPEACDFWFDVFEQCRKENIGFVNEWIDKCGKPCRTFEWTKGYDRPVK